MKKSRTVYCQFSFKRPKNRPGIGYFAVLFYEELSAQHKIAQRTIEQKLWEDQQFVTAIQSYEITLSFIHEWQGVMQSKGIGQVMLVTDNSILAGWIENPYKNKEYIEYMRRATEKYRAGAPKEISIGVGLCNVQKNIRAYYYCSEDKVTDGYRITDTVKSNKIQVENGKSIYDMLEEDEDEPTVEW